MAENIKAGVSVYADQASLNNLRQSIQSAVSNINTKIGRHFFC